MNKTNIKSRKNQNPITRILMALPIIAFAAMIAAANYMITFALGRKKNPGEVAPEATISEAARDIIKENRKKQREAADAWLESAKTRTEDVIKTSADGLKLFAKAVTADEDSHKWVMAVHGYRCSHRVMEPVAERYAKRGWNVLLPDLRGCGESGGDYLGMGWPDRKDMLQWIMWIIERDAKAEIVLHGISMGGATVMMTAGEKLPKQVKAIVADCGYTSVWAILADEAAYLFHIPSFPLVNLGSWFCKIRAGYSFEEASSLKQLKKAKVPVLFIHGSEDNFVRTDMAYENYEACASEKEMLIVEGAGHASSCEFAPELYYNTVFEFVEKYMN